VTDRDLLHEWQAATKSVARTIASAVGGGGDAARQLLSPLQRQAELLQEILEAERRLQREILGRALQPVDAVFDLLEQSGAAMRGQAEAMEHAAEALEQTAVLMKTQAELFERTIQLLREPSRRLESAAGIEPRGGRTERSRSTP
jgi:prophage DNA circulation protein